MPLAPLVIRIRFAFNPRTHAFQKKSGRSEYLSTCNRVMRMLLLVSVTGFRRGAIDNFSRRCPDSAGCSTICPAAAVEIFPCAIVTRCVPGFSHEVRLRPSIPQKKEQNA